MKLQPLADRLVVKNVEAEAKSAAGILLPDSAKEKPQAGKVLAVGKDVVTIKPGDNVLFNKYGPTEIRFEEEDLLILKQEDVIAVI